MDNTVKIKIKKLDPRAVIPTRAHKTDAGLDVYSVEDAVIEANGDYLFGLGWSCAVPEGFALIVKEKSGRAVKDKLHVGACVIDCFSKETKITTITGEKTVDQLSIGDIIISYSEETGEITRNKLTNILDSGIQEVFEVELENGSSIKLTATSLVYTKRGWKFVKDLNETDEILSLL